ncbi:AraC family ligand binding domain-containing protein [Salinarimonas sp.]|uniref:AraC family transcriptional regulator n=1 Tax=Salinarimonas sp. TaxID=2766526 RepID=UPI00391CC030
MRQIEFRIERTRIAGVVAVHADSARTFARHSHDQYGIGILRRGAQASASGRGPVEAGPGHLITVNPGEVHDGAPIGDGGRAWSMLYLDPEIVAATLADIAEGAAARSEFTEPALADGRAAARFERLLAAATAPGAAPIAAEEALIALLADRLAADPRPARAVPAGIARARALADEAFATPLDLADLARAASTSRFALLRGFVKATGLTPHAYLVQRRVAAARRAIAAGTALADAAIAAGFCDQSHMHRHFVRTLGVTPAAYARACL